MRRSRQPLLDGIATQLHVLPRFPSARGGPRERDAYQEMRGGRGSRSMPVTVGPARRTCAGAARRDRPRRGGAFSRAARGGVPDPSPRVLTSPRSLGDGWPVLALSSHLLSYCIVFPRGVQRLLSSPVKRERNISIGGWHMLFR